MKRKKQMIKDAFFRAMHRARLALTFDDVRLKSGYSEVAPVDVSLLSRFSRSIKLNIPIVSAAMDTVTKAPMAIAMAKLGGMGVIHKALTPTEQATEVRRVKTHLNCIIEHPTCVQHKDTVGQIRSRRQEEGFSFHSFPVLDGAGKLAGLITKNDFDLSVSDNETAKVAMTPFADLVTASPGTNPKEAYDLLRKKRKKVLPLIDQNHRLSGMYVLSDLRRLMSGETTLFNTDRSGHLIVGAAIGTGKDEIERALMLVEAGCDVLVIDTAHGDSKNVCDTLRELKRLHLKCDIVVGNISEGASAKRLAIAGADGIKVGQGPGSICTTRKIAGIGCPQATAVYNCSLAVRGLNVPIIADGGIRNSGDITIAIGAGAHCVMLGRMLAGTTETPGEIKDTKQGQVKIYRGMGSLAAMQASKAARERYRQGDVSKDKLVAEGVESVVLYQGDVKKVIFKQVGGLRSGMGYVGAATIEELQEKADFHRMSPAGLNESNPHDVIVIEDPR